jgi:tRNA threonylcarbamoyl adenosine modification protein (Sua5/YciO/YrdC/YwlC family)
VIDCRPRHATNRPPTGESAINIVSIHPTHPEKRVVARTVKILDEGGVVAVPTDTVYGLVCDPQNRKAVERLYRMRRLDERKPLALMCVDLSDVSRYAVVDHFAFRILRRLLPGPYCVVLPAGREAPRLLLTGKRRQIGLRIPVSPACQAILAQLGRPVCVTSAVPPEEEDVLTEAEAVARAFPDVDLVLDEGPQGSISSTVLEINDGEIVVVREGKGGLEELERR